MGCGAQSPEGQVLAVYKQLERSVQTGDADHTFIGLWAGEKRQEAEKMRKMIHPQPDIHYTSSKVFVQGNEAALVGQYSPNGFLSMRFVKEEGQWRIKDWAFSERAYSPGTVYAMIPPPAGAFERSGEPWEKVPEALKKADAAGQGWQLKAAYDESELYIRIESAASMPAPGSQGEKPPMGWPVMKVDVSGVGEFVLHATASIGDRATFDENGHAKSNLHYVVYWLMLERSNQMIFQTWAGLDPDPLIRAGGNTLELRVPLRSMGIENAKNTKIVIGDAQWPKSAIFTVEAQPYR